MNWKTYTNDYGEWQTNDMINVLVKPSQKWYDENPPKEETPQPPSPLEMFQEDLNAVAELTAQNTENNAAIAETVAYNLEDSTALGEALALALVEIENLKAEIAVLKGA